MAWLNGVAQPPRVLFIDAYDSFSNNIVSLLEGLLHVTVTKITIDSALPSDIRECYSAIVIGPGPGSPYIPTDIGCIKDVWALSNESMVPVLAICLGFQSLVVRFGGTVQQLPYPRHGIETDVRTCNNSMFVGLPMVRSVQYHSLYGSIFPDNCPSREDPWMPSTNCPDLIPLAWDVDHAYSKGPPTADDPRSALGANNPTHILMSVRHQTKPFYGVQFHPESVCSSAEARQVVCNWWDIAQEWNQKHHPMAEHHPFVSKTIPVGDLSISLIRDSLVTSGKEIIVLDSEMAQESRMGNYSLIGLVYPDSLRISYKTGDTSVCLTESGRSTFHSLQPYDNRIMGFLKAFMETHKRFHGNTTSPFWGGLMGYINYEACLETLDITSSPHPNNRPDVQFAFVERSVVVDHTLRQVHIQSIRARDLPWIHSVVATLNAISHSALTVTTESGSTDTTSKRIDTNSSTSSPSSKENEHSCDTPSSKTSIDGISPPPKFTMPDQVDYCCKIRECQDEIRRGNSYELCLTAPTHISILKPLTTSWQRYLRLRTVNPAPFGAYMRLGPLTVLSSSPERFLSWSQPDATKEITCQFRPIKGTVKKRHTTDDGITRVIDLATATNILSSAKERAENLMIVDLIRHDLAGVVGTGNVHTKSLMQIEEYDSVFQLVTVIEGSLNQTSSASCHRSGVDILAASLPPGSMTGAPKKRSCEILRRIEKAPRSIYSGVLGYMDVRGGGDFSVVIRTAYRWDDETTPDNELWHIGAGGAITDLSTEKGEWEEMRTKVDAPLRSFRIVHQV